MAIKIAVTEPECRKAEAVFSGAIREGWECVPVAAEEQTLADAVSKQQMAHAIVGVAPYRGPLYEALPSGGVIARVGVGHDSIDKQLATARGLLCTNTPGVLDD